MLFWESNSWDDVEQDINVVRQNSKRQIMLSSAGESQNSKLQTQYWF